MKKFIVSVFVGLAIVSCNNQKMSDFLDKEMERILKAKKAEVGVAVFGIESGELFSYNSKKQFPMQSVYKFHLSLAALRQVDEGKLSLNQGIDINSENLLPNTWSPLRERYPAGDTTITLKEILEYTVSQSDNNGCDILFGLVGGPAKVNEFIHNLGIIDISIVATEEEMHQDWNVQFDNWSTPLASVQLLEKFYKNQVLSETSTSMLLQMMSESGTGLKRIKGELPAGTIVAHKTGSSGKNDVGLTAALNDVGIVELPDGTHFAIAVFVTNSTEDDEVNEQIIAEIALAAYNYFTQETASQ